VSLRTSEAGSRKISLGNLSVTKSCLFRFVLESKSVLQDLKRLTALLCSEDNLFFALRKQHGNSSNLVK